MTAAPPSLFDPRTAALIAGLVYLVMPLTVWSVLYGRHDRHSTALWCLGGLILGAGYLMLGLRALLPNWSLVLIASPLTYLAYSLRGAALRRERGVPVPWPLLLAAPLAASAGLVMIDAWSGNWRIGYGVSVHIAGSIWLALEAQSLAARSGSRSARLVAGFYVLLAITLAARGLSIVFGWGENRAFPAGLDFALTLVGGLLAGLFGNLGFIGIALEASRNRELEQVRLLARAQAAHEHTLRHSQALRELLHEREDMLRLLAHEVRQPLHNASAALQSAEHELAERAGPPAALTGIERARRVMAEIAGTLDNTLASTALLSSAQPAALQDTDVDTLVGLAIGDLAPAERARVRIERLATTRTAAMDGSLMRLALRNLLSNALRYSPPGQAVTLSIADSDDPLALVIEVADHGPGIEHDLRERLFDAGSRGSQAPAGHGLGLHIVRRVMQRHGGSAQWLPNDGGGSRFRLVIPQGRDE